MTNLLCLITGLLFLCTSSLVAGGLDSNLISYYIPTHFSSPSKRDTYVGGCYGYFGYSVHSLELEWDRIFLQPQSQLTQENIMGVYTYYGLPSLRLKCGLQYLIASDPAICWMVGMDKDFFDYYGYKRWTGGFALFESSYQGIAPWQVSPFVRVYLTPDTSITTRLNTQYISRNTPTTVLNSVDVDLKSAWQALSITIQMHVGESKYSVENDGFVFFNTGDLLLDGAGCLGSLQLTPHLSLTTGYQYRRIRVVGDETESYFSKLIAMACYHF